MGIYDQALNTVYANYLPYMRIEAEETLFNFYDDLWRPQMMDLYPKTVATLSGGRVATVNDQVPIDFAADPQYMARMVDRGERLRARGLGQDRMVMQGRIAAEAGPNIDPFEFETEVRPGLLARRNQNLVTGAIKAVERRMEFELVGYTKQRPSVMNSYGNQLAKIGDMFKGFEANADFGKQWDDPTADIIDNINFMNLHMNEMGEEIKMGYIGPSTAYSIGKNTVIRDLLKYHFDLLATPIATTIQGVTLKKVIGQTYKDDAVNSNRVGFPGFGDLRFDNLQTRRVTKMMVEDYAGTDKEWGVFVPGPIGQSYMVKTTSKHTNPMVPFGKTWEDNELEYIYSKIQIGMFPFIHDPKRVIILDQMADTIV